ncbi:membrane protein [Caballeronia calidae]|uniref:Membrane protein n=1 Tax=Caballeronia calidae TaxID=1777139 RepID=A0A158E606_9BURK|nr:MFS transporter [Caballeronia calidae]SAL01856.1 membrane protein [Caballeronia calidae]
MQSFENGTIAAAAKVDDAHELERDVERRTIAKAATRLIPLIMLCYFTAYLDRTNAGIAALQMNKDIGLTASMFGFGSGLFFLLYFTMEVPSNLLMVRYGVRRWVARIMFTWGLVAGAMAFVKGPIGFYAIRALLGAAEAGFMPAIVYYLGQWFPAQYRARVLGALNVAGPVTFLIGAPISSALLGLDGLWGFRGWQWMFIVEAVPALILTGVVLKCLPDRPTAAKWLTSEESAWLTNRLAADDREIEENVRHYSVIQAILSMRVLLLGFVMFNVVVTVYSIGFFLPQIVQTFGLSDFKAGLISAIPFIAGSIGIPLIGWRSDIAKERYYHTAVPLLIAAAGLAVAALSPDLMIKMIAFSAVAFGAYGCVSAFWTLPSTFMSGAAMATGIAVVNSIGALGGFAGLWIMGLLKDATGTFNGGLYFVAAMDVLAVVALMVHRSLKRTKKIRALHQ